MLAAQIEPNYTFGLTNIPEPSLLPGGAILKMTGCGLCGSDLDKLINHKSLPGSILGHEVTGTLLEVDPDIGEGAEKLHSFQQGDRVVTSHHVPCQQCHYCLNNSPSMCREFKATQLAPGGFAQKIGLSLAHLNHTCFKIPPHITDAEASCVEPLGCVLRAVDKSSQFTFGSVAVIGLGFIGMMAAQAYKNRGFQVYGVDILENRLTLAQEHQFVNQAFHPQRDFTSLETTLSHQTPTGGVDVVFLSVVNEKTLQLGLKLIREGGVLVLFTSAPQNTCSIDPNLLYFKEITVLPSYSPSLQSLKDAADAIFSHRIQVAPLVTHTLPLNRLQEGVELYQSGKAIKVFIQPGA